MTVTVLSAETFCPAQVAMPRRSFCDFTRGRFPQIGYDNSELVATQTSRIVVFTTRVSQPLREQLQKLVALQMTETIIYLFEFVDVCKEYTDR